MLRYSKTDSNTYISDKAHALFHTVFIKLIYYNFCAFMKRLL